MQIHRRAFVIAGAAGLAAQSVRADTHRPAAEALLGAWKLIDANTIYADGRVTPWDNRPKPYEGLIVYLPQGIMAVQIAAARTPRPATAPGLTPLEKAAYFDTYYGYFGRFEIDEKASVVTHHIVSSLQPEEIGVSYRRHYDLAGDVLTLKTVLDQNQPENSYNRLVWHRQVSAS